MSTKATQKMSVHEGIKYHCDQCDYKGALKSHSSIHIKEKL